MPIHDGFYFLSAFTLHNRPIGARGHERIRPVIVQAPGTQAHKVSDDVLMCPNAY